MFLRSAPERQEVNSRRADEVFAEHGRRRRTSSRPDLEDRQIRLNGHPRTHVSRSGPHDYVLRVDTGLTRQHLWPSSVEDLAREEHPTLKPIVADSVASKRAPSPAAQFGPSCSSASGFAAGPLTGWVEGVGPGSMG